GGKNSLNRLIRCVCGKKIGPDPRNFNQRVSLGRNDLLIRTFPSKMSIKSPIGGFELATQAMVSINARAHENPSSLTLSQIAFSHGIRPLPPLQSSFVFLRAA
ncbi:hypothetical protein, partial [Klebsiella pneumoniae]|uniref:hypothetical protein n=1 Tax=Klebsiella pneumoniae TaxID=573 RepID=UPI003D1E4D10